jgi:ferredoxin-NADP reductase
MAERGATPQVSSRTRAALGLVRSFTSPLLPDDYLELVNPLWSTRELRGRIERIERETPDAVTITIKPGWDWPGHRPGQYVRLGIEVDGIHHWRAYSLTSAPARADGCIAITPKLVPDGKVSPFLFARARPGAIVRLGGVEGTFVLPDAPPERLLFVSAGSGITPIASMLRALSARRQLRDIVHIHSARTAEQVIFARELHALHGADNGYRLYQQLTGEQGRVTAQSLDALCPDWRERETYLCGPAGLLEAMRARWNSDGDPGRLHVEHFQPDAQLLDELAPEQRGAGGSIRFRSSGVEAASDGRQSILACGESAGAELPFGCRMGICHSCVGRLRAGRVRDLRTGRVHGQPGEMLQTCINAPEGAVEIDL